MALPETWLSRPVEAAATRIGSFISWIWLVLMGIIVLNVFARYILSEGRIEFEEIQWHLYSLGFLIAIALGVSFDSHIRVDVLHERFSPTTQALIDLYGYVLFVLPLCALMLIYGFPFVAHSFETGEVSASPGGLPFRWLIKSALILGFGGLMITTLARISQLIAFLNYRAG